VSVTTHNYGPLHHQYWEEKWDTRQEDRT